MTATGRALGRGIAFPPRIDEEGRMAWSEGVENIRESIRIILTTERLERVMLPAFGAQKASQHDPPNGSPNSLRQK